MKRKVKGLLKGMLMVAVALVVLVGINPVDAQAATSKTVKKGQAFDLIGDGHQYVGGIKVEALTKDTVYDLVCYDSVFELQQIAKMYLNNAGDCTVYSMGVGLFEASTYEYDEEGYGEGSDKMLFGSIKVKKGKVRVSVLGMDFETGEDIKLPFTATKIKHEVYSKYKLSPNETYQFISDIRSKSRWTNANKGSFFMLVEGKVGTTITSAFSYDDIDYEEYFKIGKKTVKFTRSYNEYVDEWDYISKNKTSRVFNFNYGETRVNCTTTQFTVDKAITVYVPYEFPLTRIK